MDQNPMNLQPGQADQGQQYAGGAYPQQSTNAYEVAYGNQPAYGQPVGQPVAVPNAVAQPQPAAATAQPAQSSAPYQTAQSRVANAGTQSAYQAPAVESDVRQPYAYAPATASSSSVPSGAHAQEAKKPSGAKTFLLGFAGALVACILTVGVTMGLGLFDRGGNGVNVTLGSSNGSIEAVEAEATLAEAVANKCLPSVVSINTYSTGQSVTGNSLYDYFYGYGGNSDEETMSGLGSGIIISDDGYVLTNYHVIANADRFEVNIEGDLHDATLVGQDSSSDVAVLKVSDATDLVPIEIGDSDNIRIGEWVMSIGSPFGLEQSVATGIVSATSRSQIMDASTSQSQGLEGTIIYPNLIQTDAAINPGNSGGALVDANGQLIGINTLISSYSGNYSGVGFAIPSNYAIGLAQDIIAGKEPTHAQLGVTTASVNDQIAQRYDLDVTSGAYVTSILDGSPAREAGIEVGDVIIGFDGQQVTSSSDLVLDVRTKSPGDTVSITVSRNGETQELEVTLGESQAVSQQSQQQSPQGGSSQNLDDLFGYGYGQR